MTFDGTDQEDKRKARSPKSFEALEYWHPSLHRGENRIDIGASPIKSEYVTPASRYTTPTYREIRGKRTYTGESLA